MTAAPRTGTLAGLAPLLAALRTWAPAYQRRWERPCGRGADGVPPWSAADSERLELLRGLDPARLASASAGLDRLAAEAEQIAAAVGALAWTAIRPEASAQCAALAARSRSRALEAGALADGLRLAADEIDAVLHSVVDRASRAADGFVRALPDPSARDAAPGVAGKRWWALGELDGLAERYGTVLRLLRSELERAVEQLPEAFRRLGPVEPAPMPGTGPVLAGTEGRRPGTETGVRIAELPDGISG